MLIEVKNWIKAKKMTPSGVCICAGCNKKLRKRKYGTTHFEHLEDIEQEYRYCRECLQAGHSLCFPHTYEDVEIRGEVLKAGKKLLD